MRNAFARNDFDAVQCRDGRILAPTISINACYVEEGLMWRSMTMGLALGAAMLMNVVPAYAQRWGRDATPRSGVCFYEDANFGGRYFCSPTGSSMTQVADNDKISSIRTFGDAVATVYRDSNFRGQSRVIDSSVNNLRSLGFNDRISSFQ